MKLLVDMNLSPRWIGWLRQFNVDAVHWSSVGAFDASDSQIMAFAVANKLVVLTHDLDFGAMLAASNADRPSVLQVRALDLDPLIIGPSVLAALRQTADELEQGALVTVDVARARIRLLPISPDRDGVGAAGPGGRSP